MAIGELRALPVGRGQIGKVKYIPVGVQGRGGRGIPSSVIKTGVKLPQLEAVKQMEKVRETAACLQYLFYSYFPALCLLDDGGAGAGGPHHLQQPFPKE